MIYPNDCFKKYGTPDPLNKNKLLLIWNVPDELRGGAIPKRIYCNRDMVTPLSVAFKNLIDRGWVDKLQTWDGCFNIRVIRGGVNWSLHSWGIAIDVNAKTNGLGKVGTNQPGFVQCFTDAGFDWGGNFTRKDSMHFQLSKI